MKFLKVIMKYFLAMKNGLAFYLNFDGTSPFTDKVNSLAANSNVVILGSGAPVVSTLTTFCI